MKAERCERKRSGIMEEGSGKREDVMEKEVESGKWKCNMM